jgi:hypothetical protein
MRLRYSLLGCLVLAACGGGGGGVVDPTGPGPFIDLLDEATRQANKLDGLGGTTVAAAGTASYVGVMILAENPNGTGDTYSGTANIDMNFSAPGGGTLDGSATGFYYFDTTGSQGTLGTQVAGTLDLDATGLVYDNAGTGPVETFDTVVSGNLDIGGVNRTASGTMDTAFAGVGGNNVDMVVGSGAVNFGPGGTFQAIFLAD